MFYELKVTKAVKINATWTKIYKNTKEITPQWYGLDITEQKFDTKGIVLLCLLPNDAFNLMLHEQYSDTNTKNYVLAVSFALFSLQIDKTSAQILAILLDNGFLLHVGEINN